MEAYTLSHGLHHSPIAVLHIVDCVRLSIHATGAEAISDSTFYIHAHERAASAKGHTKHQWGPQKGLTSKTGDLLVDSRADDVNSHRPDRLCM